MYKQHIIHAVLTVDSDLIVYGCNSILYQMDNYGHGYEVNASELSVSEFTSLLKIYLHL